MTRKSRRNSAQDSRGAEEKPPEIDIGECAACYRNVTNTYVVSSEFSSVKIRLSECKAEKAPL